MLDSYKIIRAKYAEFLVSNIHLRNREILILILFGLFNQRFEHFFNVNNKIENKRSKNANYDILLILIRYISSSGDSTQLVT